MRLTFTKLLIIKVKREGVLAKAALSIVLKLYLSDWTFCFDGFVLSRDNAWDGEKYKLLLPHFISQPK
jgi:hypothetical protein